MMTIAYKNAADRELRDNLRAYLPFFLRWVGWTYRFFTWKYGGYEAYDSCFQNPLNLGRCRHGMYPPKWMLDLATLRGDFDQPGID